MHILRTINHITTSDQQPCDYVIALISDSTYLLFCLEGENYKEKNCCSEDYFYVKVKNKLILAYYIYNKYKYKRYFCSSF